MDVAEQFKLGMRRLASGVSIVATLDKEGPKGFLATSVSSVALEPSPCLLVCVNRSVSCHDAVIESGFFSINVLARKDTQIARRFSSPVFRDQRFEADLWRPLKTGAPVYRDALVTFDCEVMTTMPVHTHTILIGKVLAVGAADENIDPLIYFDGTIDWSSAA